MIICFECQKDIKDILDSLVGSGKYKDYSEVINIAVKNYQELHKEISRTGSVVIGDNYMYPPKKKIKNTLAGDLIIPEMFKSPLLFTEDIDRLIQDYPGKSEEEAEVSKKFNPTGFCHFLPLKAIVRAIANLIITEYPDGITIKDVLKDALQEIVEELFLLGEILVDHDIANELKHHLSLSKGFPKSVSRLDDVKRRYKEEFASTFLNLDKNNYPISGLLLEYKFLVISNDGQRINLAKPAWDFIILTNPVFDGKYHQIKEKLSSEEIEFLIIYYLSSLPLVKGRIFDILALIDNGINTPSEIDSKIIESANSVSKSNIDQISKFRAEIISIMLELKLLDREKNKHLIVYNLSERGNELFDLINKER